MAELLQEIVAVDQVLGAHARELGNDYTAYRNHVYRVANLCVAVLPDVAQREKIAIAAVFHDLGIWTDNTFDYLPPSCKLAHDYLNDNGKPEWHVEITEMIRQHHKITPYQGDHRPLVETLRRADLIDVTKGLIKFGVSGDLLKQLYETWPSAGFHRRLVQLELNHFRQHPLNPLPMLRL